MTSPFVNPTDGYITLSRLESSRSRPAIWTRMRSFIGDLVGAFVRPQPDETGEAKLRVRREAGVSHLDHHRRRDEVRTLGVLARQRLDERGLRGFQRREPAQQRALHRPADAAAHPPPIEQTAGRTGRT